MFIFYPDKMRQFTVKQEVMISETQANSLKVLKKYKVNVSQFIRTAIREKIQREWKGIKEKESRIKDAPSWVYE
jgi:post-segregation antitoxin (ccd killing protein)